METVKKFIKEHPHMWWGLYLPVYLMLYFYMEMYSEMQCSMEVEQENFRQQAQL